MTGECGEPHELAVPCPTTEQPRRFVRSIQRAPKRQPLHRRPEAWFDAWWQPAMLAGAAEDEVQHYWSERGEMAGWAAVSTSHRSFDVLVRFHLAGRGAS